MWQILKNRRGIALLFAIFALVTLVAIITEVTYDTNVEYVVNAKSVNQLKAYYAAKAGMDLSLLRIKIYQTVQSRFGQQLQGQAKFVDLIWSFPWTWPPVIPEDLGSVGKDEMKDLVKESFMDGQFQAIIVDEDSKIDLNDLTSPSEALKNSTKKRLLSLIENKKVADEDWADRNQNLRPEEVINNIIDWQDNDLDSLNGGAESQRYDNPLLPPQRALRTIGELRLVAGMTEDLFQLLSPQVTIYGSKAINPNYASAEVIRSLDSSITEQCVEDIIKKRSSESLGGFFKGANEFWEFVNSHGGYVSDDVIKNTPLIFDSIANFRIKSVGMFANSSRQIEAVVYDIEKAANQLSDIIKKEKQASGDSSGGDSTKDKTKPPVSSPAQNNSSKGPPRVVYWNQN